MTNKVNPTKLNGTTTNGSLLVRDTDGAFRDGVAGDITALGIGTGVAWNYISTVNGTVSSPGTNSVTIPALTKAIIINVYDTAFGNSNGGQCTLIVGSATMGTAFATSGQSVDCVITSPTNMNINNGLTAPDFTYDVYFYS